MTIAEQLSELPAGFSQTNELIAKLDSCINTGFSRLTPDQNAGLAELASAFSGSPLAEPLKEAVAAIGRSEFLVRHFCLLAAARAALQGAQYDALQSQLGDTLGYEPTEPPAVEPTGPETHASAFSSIQQWLMEIAIGGFNNIEEAAVAPFMASLENIQAQSQLTGLASLLTGFVNELLRYIPVDRHETLPVFRWADLWTAIMIRAQQLTPTTPGTSVDGDVVLLGTNIQGHENFVCINIYGLLKTSENTVCVRIPLNSFKVDIVRGPEVWDLFGDIGQQILKAIENKKAIKVTKAELMANGDLILRSKPRLGKASDPFSVADELTPLPSLTPINRHPIHLAELVCVEGDGGFPIATDRLQIDSEITEKVLAKAEQTIGLLRFDQGRWELQPLAVQTEKATVLAGDSMLKARTKLKSKTLAILQERSSKLLRS